MQERKQDRVKFVEVSSKDFRPCEELREEIESYSPEYNIDLVVIRVFARKRR